MVRTPFPRRTVDRLPRAGEPRRPGANPRLDVRAALAGGAACLVLYVLLAAWVVPGVLDLLAALPVGARLGALLLASSATRLAGGWLAARAYRRHQGLEHRGQALPSAAAGAFAAWCVAMVVALPAGAAAAGVGALLLDALRWPAEAAVGALLAFPGPSPEAAGRDGSRPGPSLGWR